MINFKRLIKQYCILFMMMNCVLFTSCSTHQHDVKAQQSRSCVSACHTRFNQCQRLCTDNCKACEQEAVSETKKNYQRYLKERCLKGKSFIRRLQSYHDPLQCRKMTCDCPADLRVCVESCRGDIHKQIQVEKSCC